MKVDDDRVGCTGQGGEQLVDGAERIALHLQVHLPAEIDHGDAHPGGLDDRVTASRIRLREVDRAQDALLGVEVGIDLAMAVGVVAEGDHVGARREELLRGFLGDAYASRAVLAVDYDQIGHALGAQVGHRRRQGLPAGPPDDVPYEQEAHAGGSVEDRSASLAVPLAFRR